MLAEACIIQLVAAGLLMLKMSTGTFPVMYTWYVFGTSGALLLLILVLACARLGVTHTLLEDSLRAGAHFHHALSLTCTVYLALLAQGDSCHEPLEPLLLRSRIQDPESIWFTQLGTVLGIALAIVQSLIVFFLSTAAHAPPNALKPEIALTAPIQTYRVVWTAVLLAQFTQLTVAVMLNQTCPGAIECTAENIDPQKRRGMLDTAYKYSTPIVKIAVLLGVDLLEIGMRVLVQLGRVCLHPTQRMRAVPDVPEAALTRIRNTLLLLGCVWPVAVLWWYIYVMPSSECERVFRTYNIAIAVLFSACSAWLGLSITFLPQTQPASAAWPTDTNAHFLNRDNACCIGTQQTNRYAATEFRRKIKIN
jgi:hypothetical protein